MIRVLHRKGEIPAARAQLARQGLDFTDARRLRLWRAIYRVRFRAPMPPADPMKSWDVLQALDVLRAHAPPPDAPVLDMGCYNSEVLWALHALGYRDLAGCDLNPLSRLMPFWHRIRYVTGDLTRTPFPDARFAAITCLSVIEHGVPLEPLVREVRRLLRPSGVFVFTTDFDASGARHDIDPAFRAFGQTWTIFDRAGLEAVCGRFLAEGFRWLDGGPREWTHAERPVHWNDQDYTFALAALRAP